MAPQAAHGKTPVSVWTSSRRPDSHNGGTAKEGQARLCAGGSAQAHSGEHRPPEGPGRPDPGGHKAKKGAGAPCHGRRPPAACVKDADRALRCLEGTQGPGARTERRPAGHVDRAFRAHGKRHERACRAPFKQAQRHATCPGARPGRGQRQATAGPRPHSAGKPRPPRAAQAGGQRAESAFCTPAGAALAGHGCRRACLPARDSDPQERRPAPTQDRKVHQILSIPAVPTGKSSSGACRTGEDDWRASHSFQ